MQPNTNDDAGRVTAPFINTGSGETALPLYGPRPSVTRISRRAVLLTAAGGAALGLGVLVFGFGDRSTPRQAGPSEENAIRPTGPIESVRDLPKDYTFDVRQAALGIGYGTAATQPSTRPPSTQERALSDQLRQLSDLRRRMLEQERKELEQAMDSPLVFAAAKSLPSATQPNPQTAMAATPQATAHVHGSAPTAPPNLSLGTMADEAGGDARSSALAGVMQNQQSEKEAFLTKAAAVEPYLGKPLLAPLSRYELKAGSVIPGALVTAINTDLPGEVIGQVTENVYDSATGDYLLIPQGSRLLGTYQSLVTNGQDRALLVWRRLVYPDGQSIVLDGMPGTDQSGQAGLKDQVDYHLDKLAQAAALTTAIAYAGNLARNPHGGGGGGSGGYGGNDVVGDTVAQQANRVGEKIIDRQLDVQPTITIRAGWPLRVLVTKDIVLAPYRVQQ